MNMIRFNQPALSVLDQLFTDTMRVRNVFESPANIYDNDEAFVIELAAPGFTKEDIHINVEQQTLKITAEAKQQQVEDDKYLRKEFNMNNLDRSFVLPKTVDLDKISADYQNGILKLTMPRQEEAVVKKQIAIS